MITVPQYIEQLQAYKAGKSPADIQREYNIHHELFKLASNENPFGASPLGIRAIHDTFAQLHVYPDGGMALRQKLAVFHNITPEQVICSHGSEAVLATAFRTFIQPGDEIISAAGTFVGVRVQADIVNACLTELPLTTDYRFDTEAIVKAVSEKTKIVYIANPNNPTGTYLSVAEFQHLATSLPNHVLLIWDEAYCEYSAALAGTDYPDSIALSAPNVLSLRTFSKAYGMAAARIGYGVASPQIIAPMLKVKLPFEPSALSQAAGLGALDDREFLATSIQANTVAVHRLHTMCDELGLRHSHSVANFVMIDFGTPEKTTEIYEFLLSKGIITRPLQAFGLPHCLRVSTGTEEQMNQTIAAFSEFCTKK